MTDLAAARGRLVDAWKAHDRWALTLTLPPDPRHPNGRARFPGYNEGKRETDALVDAETAYAALLGLTVIECGERRRAARRTGASYVEALRAVEGADSARLVPRYEADASRFSRTVESPLLNAPAARAARDEAVDRVDRHADPEWKDRAKAILRQVALRLPALTSDDLIAAGLDQPDEPRALGPIMTWGASAGLILATDEHRPSTLVAAHARPKRVWRSLVCES